MMACAAVAQPETPAKQQTIAEQFVESKATPPLLQGANAANAYIAAWDSVSSDTRVIAGNEVDERHASTLAEHQTYVERLIGAAMMAKCDWGLNYGGGLDTQLPHLKLMRSSARTLTADATRLMQLEGTAEQRTAREREAMRRIQAVIRMSTHVREDRVLISSLVSAAIMNVGRQWVDERVRAGTLSVESAQVVLGTMRAVQTDDLFGMRDSVEGEGDIFDTWLKSEFGGADGPEKLGQFIGTIQGDGLQPPDAVISKLSREEFDSAVTKMRQFYTDNAKIWLQPDAPEQIARLAASVRDNAYGPIAMRLAAVLGNPWASDDKLQRQFEETTKLLEAYVVHNGKLPDEFRSGGEGQ
jgi:ribosomal protein L31E